MGVLFTWNKSRDRRIIFNITVLHCYHASEYLDLCVPIPYLATFKTIQMRCVF